MRIVIAEDQTMVRQALVALLELAPDLEVVGQLRTAGMPGRMVIVTTFDRPGYLRAAMPAGATGFLLKAVPSADLAARLHLSPGTFRNHLSAVIQKLGTRNRAQAVAMAQRKGWL